MDRTLYGEDANGRRVQVHVKQVTPDEMSIDYSDPTDPLLHLGRLLRGPRSIGEWVLMVTRDDNGRITPRLVAKEYADQF